MHDSDDRLELLRPALRIGVWALPAHAVLLTVSTITHQPDPGTDFPAYAAYVTTTLFLISHLLASIGGAALGVIGLSSAALVTALTSGRPRRTLLAAAFGVVGNVLNTALFGVAAFTQPAIGRAHEADAASDAAFQADVYGPELLGTAAAALLFWSAGAVMLGIAIRRSGRPVRAAGTAYAVAVPLFFLVGLPGGPLQPLVGLVYVGAAVVVARRLPSVGPSSAAGAAGVAGFHPGPS